MNSIEDLLGVGKKADAIEDKKDSNSKMKLFKDKFTLYIKELKYPLTLVASLTIIGVASKYTLFDTESEYSMQYMYGVGKEEIAQMEKSTHELITTANGYQNELVSVNARIEEKKRELDEANATVTNLTQGYYFIAYLDSLFNKHGITLDKFDINLKSVGIEEEVITINNLVDIQIPRGDYSLLPLDIEFTTTSEGMRKLFDEFYTRRIVYDNNLQVINNLDNSVTVKTSIEFTKATNTDEDPTLSAPTPDATLTETPTEQVVPEGSGDMDDWDLGGSESTSTTGTTPTTDSLTDTTGGTE